MQNVLKILRIMAMCVSFFVSDICFAAPLKFCTTSWIPYTTCEKDQVSGTQTDKIRKIASDLKYDIVISCLPWKRCLKEVKDGRYTAAFAVSFNEERAQYMYYSKEPLQVVDYVFVVSKSYKGKWSSSKNLRDLPQPIGAPYGWSVAKMLAEEPNAPRLDTSGSDDSVNFQKLIKGRIKGIIIEANVARSLIKKHHAENIVKILDPPYIDKKHYHIGFSKEWFGNQKNSGVIRGEFDTGLKTSK